LRLRLSRSAQDRPRPPRGQRGGAADRRAARLRRVRARPRRVLPRRRLRRPGAARHGQGDLARAVGRDRARVRLVRAGGLPLMLGPRLEGRNGVGLVPPTLEHFRLHPAWEVQPEASRFMGPRFGELTPEEQEKRFKDTADSQTQIAWTSAYAGEKVGYRRMGLLPRSYFRSGEWYDEWLGEAFANTFPTDDLTARLDVPQRGSGDESQHAGE